MDDWNDLRLILAVSRAGSLTAAARDLGIDHSTAFRRLKALEQRLASRLFERLPGGVYQPTEAGLKLAAGAERMEDEALALARDLDGADRSLTGRLTVTASETLAHSHLTRHLAGFRQKEPGIVIELIVDNRVLSLTRREADIALRPVRPKEGELWGRKLSGIAWALYAAPAHLAATGGPLADASAIAGRALIGWEEKASGIAAAAWLARNAPERAFVYRSSSLVNQRTAARHGIGLALLPAYLGDSDPALTRALADPIEELTGELWIVTHQDLKATARVRAFFDFVGDALMGDRDLFEGRQAEATGPRVRVV